MQLRAARKQARGPHVPRQCMRRVDQEWKTEPRAAGRRARVAREPLHPNPGLAPGADLRPHEAGLGDGSRRLIKPSIPTGFDSAPRFMVFRYCGKLPMECARIRSFTCSGSSRRSTTAVGREPLIMFAQDHRVTTDHPWRRHRQGLLDPRPDLREAFRRTLIGSRLTDNESESRSWWDSHLSPLGPFRRSAATLWGT